MRKYLSRGARQDIKFFQAIHTAADEYEALIFNKLVVDGLRVYFFVRTDFVDGGCNLGKMKGFPRLFNNKECPIARDLWINIAPFSKTKFSVRAYGKFFGNGNIVYSYCIRGHYGRLSRGTLKRCGEIGNECRATLYMIVC